MENARHRLLNWRGHIISSFLQSLMRESAALLLFTPTPVIGFLESVGKCAEIKKNFIHSK